MTINFKSKKVLKFKNKKFNLTKTKKNTKNVLYGGGNYEQQILEINVNEITTKEILEFYDFKYLTNLEDYIDECLESIKNTYSISLNDFNLSLLSSDSGQRNVELSYGEVYKNELHNMTKKKLDNVIKTFPDINNYNLGFLSVHGIYYTNQDKFNTHILPDNVFLCFLAPLNYSISINEEQQEYFTNISYDDFYRLCNQRAKLSLNNAHYNDNMLDQTYYDSSKFNKLCFENNTWIYPGQVYTDVKLQYNYEEQCKDDMGCFDIYFKNKNKRVVTKTTNLTELDYYFNKKLSLYITELDPSKCHILFIPTCRCPAEYSKQIELHRKNEFILRRINLDVEFNKSPENIQKEGTITPILSSNLTCQISKTNIVVVTDNDLNYLIKFKNFNLKNSNLNNNIPSLVELFKLIENENVTQQNINYLGTLPITQFLKFLIKVKKTHFFFKYSFYEKLRKNRLINEEYPKYQMNIYNKLFNFVNNSFYQKKIVCHLGSVISNLINILSSENIIEKFEDYLKEEELNINMTNYIVENTGLSGLLRDATNIKCLYIDDKLNKEYILKALDLCNNSKNSIIDGKFKNISIDGEYNLNNFIKKLKEFKNIEDITLELNYYKYPRIEMLGFNKLSNLILGYFHTDSAKITSPTLEYLELSNIYSLEKTSLELIISCPNLRELFLVNITKPKEKILLSSLHKLSIENDINNLYNFILPKLEELSITMRVIIDLNIDFDKTLINQNLKILNLKYVNLSLNNLGGLTSHFSKLNQLDLYKCKTDNSYEIDLFNLLGNCGNVKYINFSNCDIKIEGENINKLVREILKNKLNLNFIYDDDIISIKSGTRSFHKIKRLLKKVTKKLNFDV